jgi:hypothetical protein
MHAIQIALFPNVQEMLEPYFELSPIAEIGFDYELGVRA